MLHQTNKDGGRICFSNDNKTLQSPWQGSDMFHGAERFSAEDAVNPHPAAQLPIVSLVLLRGGRSSILDGVNPGPALFFLLHSIVFPFPVLTLQEGEQGVSP